MRSAGEAGPAVSIVVPVASVKPYTGRCLRSVVAAAAAATSTCEVILVMNGVANGERALEAILAHPLVRSVVHPKPIGAARARVEGLHLARGRFVASTDDDCLVPEEWIDALVAGCAQAPICGTRVIAANDPKGFFATIEEQMDLARNAATTPRGSKLWMSWNSTMIRREALLLPDASGENTMDDAQLSLEYLLRRIPIAYLDEPAVRHYNPASMRGCLRRRQYHAQGMAYLEMVRYQRVWTLVGMPSPGQYVAQLPAAMRRLRLTRLQQGAYLILQLSFALMWERYRIRYGCRSRLSARWPRPQAG